MNARLLSIEQASKRLGVSPQEVVYLGTEGVLDVEERQVTVASVEREAERRRILRRHGLPSGFELRGA